MKIQKCHETYDYHSGKVSDLVRQLSFAGIALVWIFKGGTADQPTLNDALLRVAVLLVIALGFDFLQYVTCSIIWGSYARWKEWQDTGREEEFEAPPMINWPALGLFWAKVGVLVIAYWKLFWFLHGRLA